MRRKVKFGLLALPFLLMILVNEFSRPIIKEEAYGGKGVKFMNPELWVKHTCSWACHNSSKFCEKHHIRYVQSIKHHIDPLYFGIINGLKLSGNYALANIIFLVVLWPLLMWFLLVRCIDLHRSLKKMKHG